MNTVKELLVRKANCIPVHSIVSALCIKYDTDSKNLRVYISKQVVLYCDIVSFLFNNSKKRVLALTLSHIYLIENYLNGEIFSAVCHSLRK